MGRLSEGPWSCDLQQVDYIIASAFGRRGHHFYYRHLIYYVVLKGNDLDRFREPQHGPRRIWSVLMGCVDEIPAVAYTVDQHFICYAVAFIAHFLLSPLRNIDSRIPVKNDRLC